MFDISEVKDIFRFAVCASVLILIYDFVMTKTGLYKRILRNVPYMTDAKYQMLRNVVNIIAIVLPIFVVLIIIRFGILAGNWLFHVYLYGSLLVLIFPGWLLISHLIRAVYEISKEGNQ